MRGVVGHGERALARRMGTAALATPTRPGKGATIIYVAAFREAPGATSIQKLLVSVSAGGSQTLLQRDWVDLSSPEVESVAGSLDRVCGSCTTERTYILRFVSGGTVLAEGTFMVSPEAGPTPTPG